MGPVLWVVLASLRASKFLHTHIRTHASFIDLHKAFDVMEREKLLEILEDQGGRPNLRQLERVFWEMATFFCQAGGNHG